MNHIGEFQKDSTISLELLTIDEENNTIATDYPPTATIELYERNGLSKVADVKLKTMEGGTPHTYLLPIKSDWAEGKYRITYTVFIGGTKHETQETFRVLSENQLIQDTVRALEATDAYPDDEVEEEALTTAEGYIAPSDFQIASSLTVEGSTIIIQLNDPAKFNTTYRVVLGKGIRTMDGERLGESKTLTFTSEYKPLLVSPIEVQSVIRSIYKYFTPHDIFVAIRDAGQKAFQLLGRNPDPNNSRYREYLERETTYFSATKFVLYEASRSLMTGLMIRILNGADDQEDGTGTGMMNETGGSIKLGDFSIADKSSSSSGVGGSTSEVKEESPLKKVQVLLAQNELELKFWKDSMMGQNKRGYAKPVSSSFRTAAGSPTGRTF